jgi:WD40 repeat protein
LKLQMRETRGVRRAIKLAVLLLIAFGMACDEATAPETPLPLPLTDRIVFESDRADPLGDIYAMTFDGGDVRRLTSSPVGETCPSISPDGNWIAYYARVGGDTLSALWLMRANGTEARPVAAFGTPSGCPLWSRASDAFALTIALATVAKDPLYAQTRIFDLASTEIANSYSAGYRFTSFSADGTELLGVWSYCSANGCGLPDIGVRNREGGDVRWLTGDTSGPSFRSEGASDPNLNQDGVTIAYSCRGASATRIDSICTIRWDRTGKTVIAGGAWFSPKFSPEGMRIAYICGGDTRPTDLCVRDAGGANTVSWPLSSIPRFVDWMPDGSGVVFVCGLKDICSLRTDNGALTNLTQGQGTNINPSMVSGTLQ